LVAVNPQSTIQESSPLTREESHPHPGPLRILMVAAEAVPLTKVSGLADVAGALPQALHDLGHDVRLVIPRYHRIDADRFGLKPLAPPFPVPMNAHTEPAEVWAGQLPPGVPVYLIDNARYFHREGIYGYPDDGERFIFFCRATLEMLKVLHWAPDVIHGHDWHTGILPNWLQTLYRDDPFFAQTASVYTIHNLAYQGIFSRRLLEIAGVDEYGLIVHPEIVDLANVVDLMWRGIRFADQITTVSPRYAQEILTPEFGEKLNPELRDRQDRLTGILNGLDVATYNPATDPHLAVRFDQASLDRRPVNKAALQQEAGLPVDPARPLIGLVSNLTDQKGFDLLEQNLDHLLDLEIGVQIVLLGTGDPHYHDFFSRLKQTYQQQIALFLTFNTALAQKIFGGVDLFLMPSRVEPCGQNQMIAMRYGAVPVVRATGGLADTVQDWNPVTGQGTGFTFTPYNRWACFAAIVRALETYRYPAIFQQIQRNGMAVNFSWAASAQRYVKVYQKAKSQR